MEISLNDRELLTQETEALLGQVHDPHKRAQYTALHDALQTGDVSDASLGALESLLTLGLRTGRVRKIHGPQAESAFLRLYQKLPIGSALTQSTNQVNRALAALEGQTLEKISFAPKGPGIFTLALDTEEYRVNLEIREEGVWLKEVGLDL